MESKSIKSQGKEKTHSTDFFNILKRKQPTSHSSSSTQTTEGIQSLLSTTDTIFKPLNMFSSGSSPSQLIVRFYDPNIQDKDSYGRTQEDILSWTDTQLERSHNYIQMLFPLPEGSMFNYDAPVIDLEVMTAFRSHDELQTQLRKSFERILVFYGFTSSYNQEADDSGKEKDEAESAEGNTREAVSSVSEEVGTATTDPSAAASVETTEDGAAGSTKIDEPSTAAPSTSSSSPPDAHSQADTTASMTYRVVRGPNFPRNSRNWAVRSDHNHLRITRILRCLRVLGLQKECDAFFAALKDVFEEPSINISNTSMMYWTRAVERPLFIAPDDERCGWLRKWEVEQAAQHSAESDEKKLAAKQ